MGTKGKKTVAKLPSQIRVFSEVVDIEFVPNLAALTGNLGQFRPGLIRLDPGQTPGQLADTLLHELMHAVGHPFMANGESVTEERAVSTLTTGLMTVFLQNPGLFYGWASIVDAAQGELLVGTDKNHS